jgi:hypothetical protein
MAVPPYPPNTLADIISKVRRITKSPSANQITDGQITQYINTYYLYDFPAELRLKDTFSNWQFTCTPNQESYVLPTDTFITIEPPLYINGYQSHFTQSQEEFYKLYPRLGLQTNNNTGNGTVGPYAIQIQNFPVLQNQVLIGALDSGGNAASATDTPIDIYTGTLSGPFIASGTINYLTGAISITFTNTIPGGNTIDVNTVPYQPSRPVAALFYDNTMFLRPIPDGFYLVEIAAYINPFACPNGSLYNPPTDAGENPAGVGFISTLDTPQIKQWWQLIAWGASLKIFEDRGDIDNYMRFSPMYEQQKLLAQRRTLVEQANERTATIYTDQTRYGGGNFFNQF